ncbi:carbohydrate sulfotransferase 11-like [Babylonia areolata]|uniref:carbohydrate sulfotransferase 11-like n=1 Tax=Babylonia areolata TaxID=304850 RepID=UPI003FD03ABC
MGMGVRWRLKRLTVVVTAILCPTLLLYWTGASSSRAVGVDSREAGDGPTSDSLTYINRAPDLSSPSHRVDRRQRAQRACVNSSQGDTMNILVFERKPSARMSYCVVPKAGCTFWIRIFRFLNNDTGGATVRTPFDISRTLAHDSSRRRMKMHRLQRAGDRHVVLGEDSTRFMFTRDPYSRVWSAFLDKLLLPDYWGSVGKMIVARRSNSSASSLSCGNDVTFEEFLEFIVDQSERRGSGSLDGHWRPIQYVCDPCQFKPFFIGKQETFMKDARAILEHFGLQNLLDGYDVITYRRDEVVILTDYNFEHLHSLSARNCTTPLQLAQRLWAAFKLNGLLPPSSNSSVLQGLHVINRDTFKRLVYREQETHWEELQLASVHRRAAMSEHYRALPLALRERFVSVYQKDFEYFGYEKRPGDIFGRGTSE